MSLPRFWWLDPTDFALAKGKLKSVREKQVPDWEWVSWRENEYQSSEEAEVALSGELGMSSMFSPGKVVVCWGLPSFHSRLADQVNRIPDNTMLVIVSRPVKNYRLYTKAKAFGKKNDGAVLLEDAQNLSAEEVLDFIGGRAKRLGLRISRDNARRLADLVGGNTDRLTNELRKLKYYCEDGVIEQWAIEQACFFEGEASALMLSKALLSKDEEIAHEIVSRVLLKEHPLQLMGLLTSWAAALLVAVSRRCDYNAIKERASRVQTLTPSGASWNKAPMWPKIGRLYHVCNEFSSSKLPPEWPLRLMSELMRLQLAARLLPKDQIEKEFHGFIARMMEQADGVDSLLAPPLPMTKWPKERLVRAISKKRNILED